MKNLWIGIALLGVSQVTHAKNGLEVHVLDRSVVMTRMIDGKLPDILFQAEYGSQEKALQSAKELKAQYGISDQIFQDEPVATTDDPNLKLWEAKEKWSMDWERKFADWVTTHAYPNVLSENSIASDCADLPVIFRWAFAREHKLPMGASLVSGNVLFTHESMKAEWASLPTHEDWKRDSRFLTAIHYMLTLSYTQTLFKDSYPLRISPESIMRGTFHLLLRDAQSGHTMFLYKTDYSQGALVPFKFLNSDLPRVVRPLYESEFWQNNQISESQGGFMQLRWLERNLSTGKWALRAKEAHPFYSLEQYKPDFMGPSKYFFEAVIKRFNPDFDWAKLVTRAIDELPATLKSRQEIVRKGFDHCVTQGNDCSPGTQAYEDWSTPNRDRKIVDRIKFLIEVGPRIEWDVDKFWASLRAKYVEIEDQKYPLDFIFLIISNDLLGSDPRLTINRRWNLSPGDAALRIQQIVNGQIADRVSVMTKQKESGECTVQSPCAHFSPEFNRWTTRQHDRMLRTYGPLISFDERGYRQFSKVASDAIALLEVEVPQGAENPSRKLKLSDWWSYRFWLNSDPSLPDHLRWGSISDQYRYRVIYDEVKSVSSAQCGALLGVSPESRDWYLSRPDAEIKYRDKDEAWIGINQFDGKYCGILFSFRPKFSVLFNGKWSPGPDLRDVRSARVVGDRFLSVVAPNPDEKQSILMYEIEESQSGLHFSKKIEVPFDQSLRSWSNFNSKFYPLSGSKVAFAHLSGLKVLDFTPWIPLQGANRLKRDLFQIGESHALVTLLPDQGTVKQLLVNLDTQTAKQWIPDGQYFVLNSNKTFAVKVDQNSKKLTLGNWRTPHEFVELETRKGEGAELTQARPGFDLLKIKNGPENFEYFRILTQGSTKIERIDVPVGYDLFGLKGGTAIAYYPKSSSSGLQAFYLNFLTMKPIKLPKDNGEGTYNFLETFNYPRDGFTYRPSQLAKGYFVSRTDDLNFIYDFGRLDFPIMTHANRQYHMLNLVNFERGMLATESTWTDTGKSSWTMWYEAIQNP